MVEPNGNVHPVADMLPMWDTAELEKLATDIKEHGLIDPIILDAEGTLLDGRNRLAACEMAEVKPKFRVHKGDPLALISAANSLRRDLSQSQKTMLAVLADSVTKVTTREAAAVAGTNAMDVSRARFIQEHAPERIPDILAGKPKASLANIYKQLKETEKAAAQPEPPTPAASTEPRETPDRSEQPAVRHDGTPTTAVVNENGQLIDIETGALAFPPEDGPALRAAAKAQEGAWEAPETPQPKQATLMSLDWVERTLGELLPRVRALRNDVEQDAPIAQTNDFLLLVSEVQDELAALVAAMKGKTE